MRRRRTAHIQDIGAKIAAARGDLSLSQGALAEAAGVSPRTVGNWENGKTTPSQIQLGLVVTYLRTKGIDLYTYTPSRGVDPSIITKIRQGEPLAPAEADEVIAAIERMNDETSP